MDRFYYYFLVQKLPLAMAVQSANDEVGTLWKGNVRLPNGRRLNDRSVNEELVFIGDPNFMYSGL